jgi:hypothetical protein
MLERVAPANASWKPIVANILAKGTLSERILAATGKNPSHAKLREVYGRLAECLAKGEIFAA